MALAAAGYMCTLLLQATTRSVPTLFLADLVDGATSCMNNVCQASDTCCVYMPAQWMMARLHRAAGQKMRHLPRRPTSPTPRRPSAARSTSACSRFGGRGGRGRGRGMVGGET
jgi:hypothetical protein